MHLRRTLAVAATALALAPTLSSCGFSPATNRIYTPAAGPIDREATVDVLSAMVVSQAPGTGTFIAGLSNNSGSETITFEAIRPVNDTTISFSDLDPRMIPPLGYENLSEPGNGIELTGDFTAGDFLTVQLAFDNGESVELDIPVVTDCDEFDGFDTSGLDDAQGEPYSCEPLPAVRSYGPDHLGEPGERVEDENSDDGEAPLGTPEEDGAEE